MLTTWQPASDQFNGVQRVHSSLILIVRVEMGPMVGATRFRVHADNDPKESGYLRQGIVLSDCRYTNTPKPDLVHISIRLPSVSLMKNTRWPS